MFYKQWSHCNWEPDNDGCLLLKVCTYVCIYNCKISVQLQYVVLFHQIFVLQSIPTGCPKLVVPSLDKQDVPCLHKDLKKYEAAGVLSEQTKKEWDLFMSQFESYGRLPEENPAWALNEIPTVQTRCAGTFRQLVVPERIMKHVQSSKEFGKVCASIRACVYCILYICIFSGFHSKPIARNLCWEVLFAEQWTFYKIVDLFT